MQYTSLRAAVHFSRGPVFRRHLCCHQSSMLTMVLMSWMTSALTRTSQHTLLQWSLVLLTRNQCRVVNVVEVWLTMCRLQSTQQWILPHHQRVLSDKKLRRLQSSRWNVLKSAPTRAVHRMLWVPLVVGLLAGVLFAVILRPLYTKHCQHLRNILTSSVTSAGHTHCRCWPRQSIKISSPLVLTRWAVTHRMLVCSLLVFCAVLCCNRKELLYSSTFTV